MTVSSASLVDALRHIALLEPAQLEEAAHLASRFHDPKALAGELIRKGWLTPFQANQLLQNKGGELVLGPHILLERLGEGGMGQVFKARHKNLGRIVALKLIRKERLDNAAAILRFQREVRAVAALAHPHIVRAFDADEIDGTHLLVMEYIEGAIDLARLVKKDGPLPAAQACAYIRQAALGLEHAHERGLVHRDIKPHNLLLAGACKGIKVLDMGLARLQVSSENTSTTMTQEGMVMGTPDYIAPEQAMDSHTADIRADLYSLGCTFYYLLAGRPPFPGGTLMEKINQHHFDEPTPLEELHPGIPAGVAAIVRRLMAKKPQDRFQTPKELAVALETLGNIQEDPKTARKMRERRPESGVPADTAQLRKDTFASALSYMAKRADTVAFEPPHVTKSRSPRWYLVGGGAVALLAIVAVLVLLNFGPDDGGRDTKKGNPIAVQPPKKRHLVDEVWLRQVASLSAEEKMSAVIAKLKELNPGFDGKATHHNEDGVITELQFFSDDVADISPVRALDALKKLECIGSNWGSGILEDLSPLEGMKLTALDCSGNRVDDLTPLLGMPLQSLACNGTRVKDLSPLSNLPLLTALSMDGTQVADLSPIKKLPLTNLSFAATKLSDLAPLKDMKLTRLNCKNTKTTDLAPLKNMPLRELQCDFQPDRDLPILRSIKSLKIVNGKSVNEK
jgi:serine/threonine protein kinase